MPEGKPSPPTRRASRCCTTRGNAHGYAVQQFVNELSGGQLQLGPGTLYRMLAPTETGRPVPRPMR